MVVFEGYFFRFFLFSQNFHEKMTTWPWSFSNLLTLFQFFDKIDNYYYHILELFLLKILKLLSKNYTIMN